MLKTTHSYIEKATLQRVGHKVSQELNYTAEAEIPLNEDEEKSLKNFFLGSIRSNQELMKFTHHVSLEYNTVYSDTYKFFNQDISFIEYSKHILNHLYEKSEHPNIKTGEVFTILFQEIQFDEITTEAIGIFKIENKIDYLKFNLIDEEMDFTISKGVKLQKIDKGCLIIKTEESDGYRVISVDNNSYDANYWKKAFLGIEEVKNDSYQTKHHLQLLSTFSNTLGEEGDSFLQKEFMSQGVQLFQENELITNDLIEEELLTPFDVLHNYRDFKMQYTKEKNIEFDSHFSVSTPTLKKEKRKIKSQINLDTNIQIKLDISEGDSVKDNIEKGFDKERKMHYYKVYYNEEM